MLAENPGNSSPTNLGGNIFGENQDRMSILSLIISLIIQRHKCLPSIFCGPMRFIAWWAGYSTLGLAMPNCSITPCRSLWMSASETLSVLLALWLKVKASLQASRSNRLQNKVEVMAIPIYILSPMQRQQGTRWMMKWNAMFLLFPNTWIMVWSSGAGIWGRLL